MFNELVLLGSLSWREVALLRAFGRYLRQVGTPFSQTYIARTLAAHPGIARQLVLLFSAGSTPRGDDSAGVHIADRAADSLVDEIGAALDTIASLDEDRILRALLHLVLATLRTNWFQTDEAAILAHASSSSSTLRRFPTCRCPVRCSSCSSTHRGWRACIYAPVGSPAVGSAGRTAAPISAPKCWV